MSTRVDAYAAALFEVAQAEGKLAEVEDELFRFARTLEGSDELRNVLTDEAVPAARRLGVVEDLLGPKASPTSVNLVSFVIGGGRGRDLLKIVEAFVQRATTLRKQVVAEVRSAIDLDEDQRTRLAASLSKATGKDVSVKVIVDPTILGGVVAQIGDTVIDGSVRHRLDQLRARI